jgi:hypothetical protein
VGRLGAKLRSRARGATVAVQHPDAGLAGPMVRSVLILARCPAAPGVRADTGEPAPWA